jgi:hypothetical protein
MPGPAAEVFYSMRRDEAELVLVESLLLRAGLRVDDYHPDSERLAEDPKAILGYAESLLVRNGIVDYDEDKPNAIVARAFTFGLESTIESAVRLAVLTGYTQASCSHRLWVGYSQTDDYRLSQIGYQAPQPELKPAPQGLTDYATLSGSSELGAPQEYGRILQCGRRALASNDISEVLVGASSFGQSADTLEANLVYTALSGNATLSDGVALFHSTHANIGATHVPDATGIGAALVLLRAMTDENAQYLPLTPAAIIVPPAQEVTALAAVTALWGIGPDRPAVRGEPRLTAGNYWYLFCRPAERPVARLITLRGAAGPHVTTGKLPGYDGLAIKAFHDVSALAVDYRGAIRTLSA